MNNILNFSAEKRKFIISNFFVKCSYKIVLISLCVFALFIFSVFKINFDEKSRYRNILKEKQIDIVQIREKVEILEKRIEELNTLEGIEKEARQILGMVKKGEKILRPFSRKKSI
ncbi:MAG: septum formation initiator family protein [Candidatus Muirbacterium halophilum]|nr:septum formation initiator family protein [Candidatus Muirbacterium halophilum]MCK9476008.1 septum formation initiator family protein [Candidatus Muirbacterium halophilum]